MGNEASTEIKRITYYPDPGSTKKATTMGDSDSSTKNRTKTTTVSSNSSNAKNGTDFERETFASFIIEENEEEKDNGEMICNKEMDIHQHKKKQEKMTRKKNSNKKAAPPMFWRMLRCSRNAQSDYNLPKTPTANTTIIYNNTDKSTPTTADNSTVVDTADAAMMENYPFGVVTSESTSVTSSSSSSVASEEADDENDEQQRERIMTDAMLFQKYAIDYLHPEIPVELSDPTAMGRDIFRRYNNHHDNNTAATDNSFTNVQQQYFNNNIRTTTSSIDNDQKHKNYQYIINIDNNSSNDAEDEINNDDDDNDIFDEVDTSLYLKNKEKIIITEQTDYLTGMSYGSPSSTKKYCSGGKATTSMSSATEEKYRSPSSVMLFDLKNNHNHILGEAVF